jgi:hypothetical protein
MTSIFDVTIRYEEGTILVAAGRMGKIGNYDYLRTLLLASIQNPVTSSFHELFAVGPCSL